MLTFISNDLLYEGARVNGMMLFEELRRIHTNSVAAKKLLVFLFVDFLVKNGAFQVSSKA
jgi:hypothetical protein